MNWELIFQIVVLISSSSALGIGVKSWTERKKIHVDTDSVAVTTALATVTSTAKEVDDLKEDIRRFRNAMHAHEMWDRKVMRELAKHDIQVEEPPELFWI